jgi:hypothetical protein
VVPLFRLCGQYYGFIVGADVFDAAGTYRGWVYEGQVWRADGRYIGRLLGGFYVVRGRSDATPADCPPLTPPPRPTLPAPCADISPWSPGPDILDAIDLLDE